MGSSGGYSSIIMIVLMLVIFYLFLILPENKKKKKLNEMRSNLKVGDDIVTIGGSENHCRGSPVFKVNGVSRTE